MLYDIVNPSDPCTMVANDHAIAAAAVLALGCGKYALHQVDGDFKMPVFLLGGALEWFKGRFGIELDAALDRTDEVAGALESAVLGTPAERDTFERGMQLIEDPQNRKLWADEWHERKRSSMNDIARSAWQLAISLRETAKKGGA